jgi:hypothetical protein
MVELTHPSSPKEPDHRLSVKRPSQKKTPPLIQWANPLKIFWPSYRVVRSKLNKVRREGGTHEEAPIGNDTSAQGDEAENQARPVDEVVSQDEDFPRLGGNSAGGLPEKELPHFAMGERGQHLKIIICFVLSMPPMHIMKRVCSLLVWGPRPGLTAQRLGVSLCPVSMVIRAAVLHRGP